MIRPDSLTAAEREFAKDLGNGLPQYRDALTSIALEAKKTHGVTNRVVQSDSADAAAGL